MGNHKVSQQQVDRVLSDARYLQKEAEALTSVINDIPYRAQPPEGYSISQILLLIDHAQQSYYNPIIDNVTDRNRSVSLQDVTHFTDTFDPPKGDDIDIHHTLKSLAKHRGLITNKLDDLTLIDWRQSIYIADGEITLLKFIQEMTHNDQIYLKEITKLIQAYHQEKKSQKAVDKRQQKPKFGDNRG